MLDCRNYGRYPFCKHCKNNSGKCIDSAVYTEEEKKNQMIEALRNQGIIIRRN